mmetsp:Transcript_67318/g.194716  ORF Transcript_67318/g.194716 Transcript_67318/m.194716 type:complete len:229 (-) Transcript_67318:56-742(-)
MSMNENHSMEIDFFSSPTVRERRTVSFASKCCIREIVCDLMPEEKMGLWYNKAELKSQRRGDLQILKRLRTSTIPADGERSPSCCCCNDDENSHDYNDDPDDSLSDDEILQLLAKFAEITTCPDWDTRGFEHLFDHGEQRTRTRIHARMAVLTEQARQLVEGVYDGNKIAVSYSRAAKNAQEEAHKRALMDQAILKLGTDSLTAALLQVPVAQRVAVQLAKKGFSRAA